MINKIRRRVLEKLEYKDPAKVLHSIRDDVFRIQTQGPSKKGDKQIMEMYQGAYLAMFVKVVAEEGQGAQVSTTEHEDFDCVIRTTDSEGGINYLPVQLKGLPNRQQNERVTVQEIVNLFEDYKSSPELVGGLWINRDIKFDLADLVFDRLTIGQLWMFGDRPDEILEAHGGPLNCWKNGWCFHIEVKNLTPTWKELRFKDQPKPIIKPALQPSADRTDPKLH